MTPSIPNCRRECCIHNLTFQLINYCSGRPPERWNASSWGPDFTLINFILIIIINYFSAQAAAPKGEMKFNYEMDCTRGCGCLQLGHFIAPGRERRIHVSDKLSPSSRTSARPPWTRPRVLRGLVEPPAIPRTIIDSNLGKYLVKPGK